MAKASMPAELRAAFEPLVSTQEAQLIASDGEFADLFGYSVAVSGDTALIGAPNDDAGLFTFQGSAYLFTRNGATWTQQAKLVANDGADGDHFGHSVALSGDTALVGALMDDVGLNGAQGSAYIFTRSGDAWTQQAKLVPDDGALNDRFGYSVALSGDTALVGAEFNDVGTNVDQGAAYVFTRSGETWTKEAKLIANDGTEVHLFGDSVSLSGDTALVGAPVVGVGTNTPHSAAYVFTRNGVVWTQQAMLIANDGAEGDRFGSSVSLSGDTALVGAPFDAIGANIEQGSAYIFTRCGVAWTQHAKLIARDGAANDNFGISVALSGDAALVGASENDVGANANQGAAYVFTRCGEAWTEQAKLIASDGQVNAHLGKSVALSGDTALAAAILNGVAVSDAGQPDQGSVYVFHVGLSNGDAFASVDGVCCNVARGDSPACVTAEGGCECRMGSVGTKTSSPAALLGLGLAVLTLARRRRLRTRSPILDSSPTRRRSES